MTRAEKIAEARRLRGEGLSNAAIGARLGVHGSTVRMWLLDPEERREKVRQSNARRRVAKREWEREWLRSDRSRGRCPGCGELAGAASVRPSAAVARCAKCRGGDREERRERIAEMWGRGASLRVIAEALGSTPKSVGVEMFHMRADGWVLPFRREGAGRRAAA